MKNDEQRIAEWLKQSLAPVGSTDQAGLRRDLWPAMLRRLEQRAPAVPWFDWALLAAVVVWLALFPRVLPMFLYHL